MPTQTAVRLDRAVRLGVRWRRLVILTGALAIACACALVDPRALVAAAALGALITAGLAVPSLTVRAVTGRIMYESTRGQVGSPFHIHCKLAVRTPWPVYGLIIDAGWEQAAGPASDSAINVARFRVDRLFGFRRYDLRGTLVPHRRGLFPTQNAALTSRFPFDLVGGHRTLETEGTALIWPQIVALALPKSLASGDGIEQAIRSQPADSAGDLPAMPPQRPGEPPRRIDWKRSARHERLVVSAGNRGARQKTLLILDATSATAGDVASQEQVEKVISVAASLLVAMVDARLAVTIAWEASRAVEVSERGQLSAVFDALARFDVGDAASAEAILHSAASEGLDRTAIIVLTRAAFEQLGAGRRPPNAQFIVIERTGSLYYDDKQADADGHSWAVHVVSIEDRDHQQLQRVCQELLA